MWIGIDDTDSIKGGCTTYLAALICEEFNCKFLPRLIRLNPNIPHKTRGNGAVALNIEGSSRKIKEFTLNLIERKAHFKEVNTNPGIVFIEDIKSTDQKLLKAFYLKAVSQYVEIKEADELSSRISAEVHRFKNGRGVIGALAALGSVLEDRTYELIAYRNESAKGLRKIDVKSVFDMNAKTYPSTYDNVDLEEKKVLIMPRGRDPVFCGIRGESVDAVNRAWDLVKPLEGISLVQVFETNQGTDCHLKRKGISDVMPYDCVISEGIVSRKPKTVEGGHVIFGLSDATGFLWCAAYEPTGGFRDIIRDLQPGDIVKCCGGVGRHPNTLNLEKIFISKLSKISIASAPMCCGKRMTSAGSSKGFKCRKCGKRASLGDVDVVDVERKLNIGWYEVPPRSRRHLSRPLIRDLNNA